MCFLGGRNREKKLIPWSRVLLEKLTVAQLVKKFPAFYGTRRSVHSSQQPATRPYPEPDEFTPHSHTDSISPGLLLILSSHLCLRIPTGLFPSCFPTKLSYALLIFPMRATCSHPILLDLIVLISDEEYKS
jgi:hypothetical protein